MTEFTTIKNLIGPDVDNCECCHAYPAQTDHQDYGRDNLDNVLRVCWPCHLAGLLGHHFSNTGLNLFSRISALVRYQDFTKLERLRDEVLADLLVLPEIDHVPIMEAWDTAIPEIDRRVGQRI